MTRDMVIEKWLQAKSRNRIADETGLGKGTVSAVIEEWSQSTGKDLAFQLRDFVLALANSGLSLTDCITGFRVALNSKKCGIRMDELEHFLAEIYPACLSKGLEPRCVAQLLEDVFSLFGGLNSISAVSDQLRRLKAENENLTNANKRLKEETLFLHAERDAAEELRNAALENDKVTQDSLNWYRGIKTELGKYGIPVDDIGKFTETVKGVSEAGYDPNEVVVTSSEFHTMKYATHNMQRNLGIKEKVISGLEEKEASLERSIASRTQTLSQLEQLDKLGIGMKQLLTIRSAVTEIAKANDLDDNLMWKKFVKDLELYDARVGFEREIQDQRVKLRQLIFQINTLSEYLGMLVADSFQTKMGHEQKWSVANILNRHPTIVERVADHIEQTTINTKKREDTEAASGGYAYEVENGDIVDFDPKENRHEVSAPNFCQYVSPISGVTVQFDSALAEIEEYKRLFEESKKDGTVDN